MLRTIDYKTLHTKYYHIGELKASVRVRDSLVITRSTFLIRITNCLDNCFPEFKPFFNNRFGSTAFFVLETFKTRDKISKLNKTYFEKISSVSKGKFSYVKFTKLLELAKSSVGANSDSYPFLILSYINLYHEFDKKIDDISNKILKIMINLNTTLTSIPDVTPLFAANILAEIGDFNNFSNSK